MASIIVEETTIVSVNTMNVDFNATNWSNSLMEQSWNTLTELKPSSTYFLELFVFIIGVIVLSLIMILIYRYRLLLNEDQKLSKAFHSTNRRFKRQSSRFSIDLDRFVADISGFDQNELNNAESNHIRFPIVSDTKSLNPLAVSIVNLVNKSLDHSKSSQLHHHHHHHHHHQQQQQQRSIERYHFMKIINFV